MSILTLPLEIYYAISLWLNHKDYISLRLTCSYIRNLNPVQTLFYPGYIQSTDLFHDLIIQPNPKIKLDFYALNDESFIFIAECGHAIEFIRLLRLLKIKSTEHVIVSSEAKEIAFKIIIQNEYPPEMLLELLLDGHVDPSIRVEFNVAGECIEEGTALHWVFDLLTIGLLQWAY